MFSKSIVMLFQTECSWNICCLRSWSTGAPERHSIVRTLSPLGPGQGQVLHSHVHLRGRIHFIKPSRTVNLIQDRAEFSTGPAHPRRPRRYQVSSNCFISLPFTTTAADARQAKSIWFTVIARNVEPAGENFDIFAGKQICLVTYSA